MPNERLASLDVLRGFTMFWIVGGAEVVIALLRCLHRALGDAAATQATHASWHGLTAWDLIMPVFLFVVGAALPLAIGKRLEQGQTPGTVYPRLARRAVVLWVLGMIAQGSLLRYHVQGLELYSNTLQAIAVGYVVTAIALMHLGPRGQVLLFVALTAAYWALLMLVPFGGHPAGTLQRDANLAFFVDEQILGAFRRDHHFTWVVTSLGFSATVLLGALAGQLLRATVPARRKLLALVALGLGCMAVGWLWSYSLPLNRHIWTSSLILWAGGWSFLLLALFYGVIDVAGLRRWASPFGVIGANALVAYVFSQVFDRTISDVLVIRLADQLAEPYGELLRAVAALGVLWLILWYLYRNRTFVRA